MKRPDIPLDVLVCDTEADSAETLTSLLSAESSVHHASHAPSLYHAQRLLQDERINVIFVDPLSLGLEQASDFVFACRKSMPQIVFVLYTDFSVANKNRAFYTGERRRFKHYYYLDKGLSPEETEEELKFALLACQLDLRWRLSEDSRKRVGKDENEFTLLDQLRSFVSVIAATRETAVKPGSVFVSYSFDREEYINSLTRFLQREGFEVVTGKAATTSISQAILHRIRGCEYFLSIMTCHSELAKGGYAPSPWLLEEKGVALALGKRIVLMVEDGVAGFGEMQADWQRIHFVWDRFADAVADAVEQLCSFRNTRVT